MSDRPSAVSQSAPPGDKQARIAERRARYDALRAEGQTSGSFASRIEGAPRIPRDIPAERLRLRASVAPGWHWYGRVPAGACLRLDNEHGTPGVACMFWNADDPGERFCATDTVKAQWTSRIGRGRMLLSDMGRVLMAIVEDTCGRHDALLGAGAPRMDAASSPLDQRNSAENLVLGAVKLGLTPRDLHAPITFFAPVGTDDRQNFHWDDGVALAGSHVDLHAEMDVLAVVSNAPHPLAPGAGNAAEIGLAIWRPQPGVSRFCRDASDEAGRAFARTAAYLDEKGAGS